MGVNVAHADTVVSNSDTQNTSTNESNINKDNILPVANNDNDSLQQIADNNNDDVSGLENLNDNVDQNEPLPDGTPIYLPQNAVNDTNSIFNSFASVSPYSNVSSSIKRKYYDTLSAANRSAKNWIAFKESSYSYTASNGNVYGRFQLTRSYLHGDYSIENQEKTANAYVIKTYGSWVNAKQHWLADHWY